MIHPEGLKDDIRKAVVDGKVMKIVAGLDDMERQLHRPVEEVLDELKEDESYSLISVNDVYSLEGWVGVDFEEGDDDEIPLNVP